MELSQIINEEVKKFEDLHKKLRGPRHRGIKAGLNTHRKHQNVIAAVHKADPNKINALEELRGMRQGRRVVAHHIGQKLKELYGLKSEEGYLGTTGIKLTKLDQGYELVKEAIINIGFGTHQDDEMDVVTPDEIFNMPGSCNTFAIKDGLIWYSLRGIIHADIAACILGPGEPTRGIETYPTKPTRSYISRIRNEWAQWFEKWKAETPPQEQEEWTGLGNIRQFFDITGRASEDQYNVVAFWNTSAQVSQYKHLLQPFLLKTSGMRNPILVTSDNEQTSFKDLSSNKKIDTELMKHKHLSPEIKKLDAKDIGNKSAEVAQKAGYSNAAEFKHAQTIGDSVNA